MDLIEKSPQSNHPDALSQQVEAFVATIAKERASPPTEPEEGISAEATMHSLRKHQIELDRKTEEVCRLLEELDASRKRYFDLYDQAPVGYLTLDDAGLILETNLTAASLLHVKRSSLLMRPLPGFILKEDQPIFSGLREQLAEASTPLSCDLRMVRSDGIRFWAHLAATKQGEGSERSLKIVLSDISDNKRMERMLTFLAKTGGESRVETFLNRLAPYLARTLGMDFVHVDILDSDGCAARTVVIWRNGHFEEGAKCALKDSPCAEILRQGACCFPSNVRQIFPHSQMLADALAESFVGVALTGKKGELVGLIACIGKKPLANRAYAEATLNLVADRTGVELERILADESLRREEALASSILESLPCIFYLYTYPELRLVRWNKMHETILGYGPEELAGRHASDWYLPEEKEAALRNVEELMKAGGGITEASILTKDGRQIPFHFTVAPFESNGRSYFIGAGIDLTQRKQMEQRLIEKTAEMERFTYTVSHDLKSPLVTIKAFLGYLEKDLQARDPEHVAKDMGYINCAADKMALMLGELLELARIGHNVNRPEAMPLNEVVQEALGLVNGQIDGRGVDVVITQEPVWLYGDRPRLVEVFQNLLDNAVKFLGDQPSPRVEIGVEHVGDGLEIFVRDNGKGIDPRHQHKLFGLFEKLDAGGQGSGLGLAIVRRVIELHGGKIRVESEGLGQGTTFRFTLANTRLNLKAANPVEQ